MRRLACGLVFCVAAVAACGIDVTGTYVADGGLDGGNIVGTTPDGAPNETNDGATSEAGPTGCACNVTAPSGFTLVAFRPDQKEKCVGDLETDDRVTGPTIGAHPCSCNPCQVTTAPSCTTGSFSVDFDNRTQMSDNQCDDKTQTLTHDVNADNCITQGDPSFPYHGQVVAAPLSGGACSAPSTADQTAVKSTPVRMCAPTANGTTCACDAKLPGGFKTCFRAPGDVGCPAGTKTLVSSATLVTCDPCSCKLTGTCSGKATFYDGSGCTGNSQTLTDTSCDYISANSYGSFKYTGTLKSPGCAAGTPPAGTVAPSGTIETICCP